MFTLPHNTIARLYKQPVDMRLGIDGWLHRLRQLGCGPAGGRPPRPPDMLGARAAQLRQMRRIVQRPGMEQGDGGTHPPALYAGTAAAGRQRPTRDGTGPAAGNIAQTGAGHLRPHGGTAQVPRKSAAKRPAAGDRLCPGTAGNTEKLAGQPRYPHRQQHGGARCAAQRHLPLSTAGGQPPRLSPGCAVFDSHFVTWVVLADSRPSERQNFRRLAAPVSSWPCNVLAGETDLQLLSEYVIHCLSWRSMVQEAMQP